MANITEEEHRVLEKFRLAVTDLKFNEEQKSDEFLIAWLRARDLNISKAHDMLKKSLEWREKNDIDNILKWTPPSSFPSEFPYEISGMTPEGNPVFCLPIGQYWNIRKAVESGYREDWLKYTDQMLGKIIHKMKENSNALGQTVTQCIAIIDFDQFSMRQLASISNINTILDFVRRYEGNYPEILKAVFLINGSRTFTILFGLVKPLLSQRTMGKLQIFGTNKSEWQEAILKFVPADQLHIRFGGISENSIIQQLVNSKENFTKIFVKPGKKHVVDFDVTEPQTFLSWKFKSDGFDIGFSIVYNNEMEIQKYSQANSHLNDEIGSICCEKTGKYSIVFDNTYSRFRGKTLHYIINMIPTSYCNGKVSDSS